MTMNALQKIPRALREHARSLEDLGLAEVAWPLDRIGDVLHSIKDAGVAVLGGDVYEDYNGQLRATYDNWHCEREATESFADYARSSWQRAWDYTLTYPRRSGRAAYIALVLSDEPTAGL